MTAIQGFIPASRRAGELGIHSLDSFHFTVPDFAEAQRFYREFGLDMQTKGNLLTMGCHS
jgi:catechol 2,3-dioxygenase